MQVNMHRIRLSLPTEGVNSVSQQKSKPVPGAEEQTQFHATRGVEAALRQAPEVRASEVARARTLAQDVGYPAPAHLRALSRVLSDGMAAEASEG